MNQKTKHIFGTFIVLIPVFVVLALWLAMAPISSRIVDLSTLFLSLGRISGLLGLSLYALSLILHIRIKFLKKLFLDGAYICKLHHELGSYALILLLIHPLAFAIRFANFDSYYAARFLLPFDNLVNLAGFVALLIMIVALVVTYYYNKNHSLWLWAHRAMLVAYAGAFLHLFFVSSDTSVNPILKYYMILLMAAGLLAFAYQRLSRYFPESEKRIEVCE